MENPFKINYYGVSCECRVCDKRFYDGSHWVFSVCQEWAKYRMWKEVSKHYKAEHQDLISKGRKDRIILFKNILFALCSDILGVLILLPIKVICWPFWWLYENVG